MRGARFGNDSGLGKLALGLLAVALLLRMLVPAGWMPTAGGGYAITLCTGMGAQTGWVDDHGRFHKQPPTPAHPEQPCAFAGMAVAFDLPAIDMLPTIPVAAPVAVPFVRSTTPAIGHGLAAPPPPPTGPPALA